MFLRNFKGCIVFHSKRRQSDCKVLDEKCYPSPIPKGGLEILWMVQFKIANEKQ